MIGQDAVRTAAEFDRRLGIDGFILTKLDGDARGGAALSIKEVTGKPIKFLGMGEGLDKLEEFRPEGLASRILGIGDVVGLMKDFEEHVDEEKAEDDAKKLLSGDFTLDDFVEQIRTIRKMGPHRRADGEVPDLRRDAGGLPVRRGRARPHRGHRRLDDPGERQRPDSLNESRIRRVARGSGRKEKDVKDLLKQYHGMRGVMRAVGSAPGLLSRLPGMKQLANLRKSKGQGMEDVLGDDASAVSDLMEGRTPDPATLAGQMAGLPKGMQPRLPAGALARARLMGYAPEPISTESAADREARNKKRKRERQARKKARRKKSAHPFFFLFLGTTSPRDSRRSAVRFCRFL